MIKIFYSIYCIVFFSCILFGQNYDKYKSIDWRIYHSLKWQEHIDYKSEEWKNMPIAEKISLFQIPKKELESMTTKELIEATIDCHFARRIGLFSTIEKYYERITETFNGFNELLKRNDATYNLILYYKNLDIYKEQISPAGLSTKDQIQILEYIIVHPIILNKFDNNEKLDLFTISFKKYESKITIPSVYNEGDLISNIYVLAKLLEIKNEDSNRRLKNINAVELFLKSGLFLSEQMHNEIINICKYN